MITQIISCCCYGVPESRVALCNPIDYSMPGFPVLCYLPEFAQVHVHWVRMLSDHLILCQSVVQAKSIAVIPGTLLSFTPQTNQQSLLALPSHSLKSEYHFPCPWLPSGFCQWVDQQDGRERGQRKARVFLPHSLCFRLASLAVVLSPHSRGTSSMAPWLLGSPLTLFIPFFATPALGIISLCLFCLASLSMVLQIAPSSVSSFEPFESKVLCQLPHGSTHYPM